MHESQEHPFKETLQDTEFSPVIKKLYNSPNKLVREWKVEEIEKREDIDLRIAEMKRGMKIFDVLRDNYGLNVVKTELILGGSKKDPKFYMVVDKIEGSNLNRIKNFPSEILEEIDDLFIKIIKYYSDVYKNGGDYWWDFGNRQIVYGYKTGEEKDKFYIVDVEPRVREYKKHSKPDNFLFFSVFENIIIDIKEAEKKFPVSFKLIKSRDLLRKFLDSIPSPESEYKYIITAKKYLEQ